MVASPVANADAEVHAAKNRVELLLERLGRTAGEESSEPFGEYLERWLLLQQLRLAPSTHRAYRMTVDAYILPRLGDRPLRELSTRELNDVFIELARCGGQGGRSLAASTVRYVHRLIHKALEDAVREGALVINVATRSSPPRRDVEGRKIASTLGLGRRGVGEQAIECGVDVGAVAALGGRQCQAPMGWQRLRDRGVGHRIDH